MRRPLLAGNWKMNTSLSEGVELVEALLEQLGAVDDRDVLVCPPFTALGVLGPLLEGTPLALGAQNMHHQPKGAFTGEIAPPMLKELGCSYVILGHSERRQLFGENDELVNRKTLAALEHGLRPIVCVGETKAERDAGRAEDVVVQQLRGSLQGITPEQLRGIVIAYEPVWAIGTGDTATPQDAQSMHATIRRVLGELSDAATAEAMIIQYGGSVKADNVDELMAQPDIDGALVGGASLKASEFARIVRFETPR